MYQQWNLKQAHKNILLFYMLSFIFMLNYNKRKFWNALQNCGIGIINYLFAADKHAVANYGTFIIIITCCNNIHLVCPQCVLRYLNEFSLCHNDRVRPCVICYVFQHGVPVLIRHYDCNVRPLGSRAAIIFTISVIHQ